jgi:hypothetical protein
VHKAKALALRLGKPAPVLNGLVQKLIRAEDIRLNKGGGSIYGAVDLGFSREMQNRHRRVMGENACYRRAVTYIRLLEEQPSAITDRFESAEVRGVGQLVDHNNGFPAGRKHARHRGPDETCATRDQVNQIDHHLVSSKIQAQRMFSALACSSGAASPLSNDPRRTCVPDSLFAGIGIPALNSRGDIRRPFAALREHKFALPPQKRVRLGVHKVDHFFKHVRNSSAKRGP